MRTALKALACAATVVLAFAGVASTSASAAATAPGAEDCVPFQTVDVTYIDAHGASARTWAHGDGLVATYSGADGLTRRAQILPAGLTGDTAPAAVLTALHVTSGGAPAAAHCCAACMGPPGLTSHPTSPPCVRRLGSTPAIRRTGPGAS